MGLPSKSMQILHSIPEYICVYFNIKLIFLHSSLKNASPPPGRDVRYICGFSRASGVRVSQCEKPRRCVLPHTALSRTLSILGAKQEAGSPGDQPRAMGSIPVPATQVTTGQCTQHPCPLVHTLLLCPHNLCPFRQPVLGP